jgi:hypothetical protein
MSFSPRISARSHFSISLGEPEEGFCSGDMRCIIRIHRSNLLKVFARTVVSGLAISDVRTLFVLTEGIIR